MLVCMMVLAVLYQGSAERPVLLYAVWVNVISSYAGGLTKT